MKQEVKVSNPGGVKCFSTRLSFESCSSDISRFMFVMGEEGKGAKADNNNEYDIDKSDDRYEKILKFCVHNNHITIPCSMFSQQKQRPKQMDKRL